MYSAAEGRAAAAHPLMLAVSAAGLLGLLPNTGLRSLLEGQITTAGLLQRYFTDASDPPPASDQSRQNCYHPVAQGLRERAVAVLDRPELGALGKRAALVWARYLSRADPSGDEMDASSDETGAGATNELDVLSRRSDSGMSMLADVSSNGIHMLASALGVVGEDPAVATPTTLVDERVRQALDSLIWVGDFRERERSARYISYELNQWLQWYTESGYIVKSELGFGRSVLPKFSPSEKADYMYAVFAHCGPLRVRDAVGGGALGLAGCGARGCIFYLHRSQL